MRVLHVINSLQLGGAEVLLANSLAHGALPDHAQNHLVYFGGEPVLIDRIDPSVRLTALNYKGGADIVRLFRQLRKVIKEHHIDIIHSHLTPSGLYTHLLNSGIPHVHTLHTTYSMDTETRSIMLSLERKLYYGSRSCNVICLTEFAKNDFLNSVDFRGKAFVLNNFISDAYFNISPKTYTDQRRSLRIIAIGTLKPLKNFEYLLDVFVHLKGYNIALDIYGGGDTEAYEKVIQRDNLNVRLMGPALNMSEIIGTYDLFIMPSRFEGLPLSLFEAMAASVPVIVSDIAPLRAIVKEHGVYFKLDDPALVAKQLMDIFNGDININKQAIEARQYAELTVRKDIYISKLLNIYKSVIADSYSKVGNEVKQ